MQKTHISTSFRVRSTQKLVEIFNTYSLTPTNILTPTKKSVIFNRVRFVVVVMLYSKGGRNIQHSTFFGNKVQNRGDLTI